MSPSPKPRFSHLPGRAGGAPQLGGDGTGSDLAALLEQVKDGEEPALADLYRATAPMVFGMARQILRDQHLAEDATVDVFQRVWQSAATYRSRLGSPLVWLLAIARHHCIDMLRRRRSTLAADDIAALATELTSPQPSPVEIANDRERVERIRHATTLLPRGQREVLAAAYFGGMSQSEIATTLDVPLGTVKTRVRQALQTLRRELDGRETETS